MHTYKDGEAMRSLRQLTARAWLVVMPAGGHHLSQKRALGSGAVGSPCMRETLRSIKQGRIEWLGFWFFELSVPLCGF